MNNKLIYHLIGLRFMENSFISNTEQKAYQLISDHFESSWSIAYHANLKDSESVILSFRNNDEFYGHRFTVNELSEVFLSFFKEEAGLVLRAVQGLCKTPEAFFYKNQSVDDL